MLKWALLLILSIAAIPAAAADPVRQVFIAGDSTASQYGPERARRAKKTWYC